MVVLVLTEKCRNSLRQHAEDGRLLAGKSIDWTVGGSLHSISHITGNYNVIRSVGTEFQCSDVNYPFLCIAILDTFFLFQYAISCYM